MSSGMLVEPRAKRHFDDRRGGDGRLPFPHLISLLLLFVLLLSPPSLLAQTPPPEMTRTEAQAVVDAIRGWDGARPGDLFASIRRARPGAGAITSMRELNRYASGLSPEVQNMITENQRIAQETIRQRILDVRTRVIQRYLEQHPEHARSLYGYGDIGSWALQQRDRLPTAEMDVDWTIFGADPEATAELRNLYNQELLRDLAGDNTEGLQLVRDFDIVVTAEGHEAQSHVFETRGGVDWAKRNMRRVTILNPNGTTNTYDLARGQDPVFELAMAQNLAALRSAATRGGNYGDLFDANGNLRPQDEIPRELWDRYTSQLEAVDYYISKRSTAAGGCFDMTIHQQREAAQRNYEPISAINKNLKYVFRSDNIVRGANVPDSLIAKDPVLGDEANSGLISLAKELGRARDKAAAAEIVRTRYGGNPSDAAIQSVVQRSRTITLRYAEIAYQAEMDRIVMELTTKEARKAALDALTDDFRILSGEGGEYAALAESALKNIAKVQEANDAGMIDQMRGNWTSLEKIGEMNQTLKDKTKAYLNQTELGRKILEKYSKVLDYARKPMLGTGEPFHASPALDVLDAATEAVRTQGATVTQYLGSAAMWVAVVDNVRSAKSDAELAIKLGETLAMNTYYGMIASSLYAGIVQRDAKALARAIMYMLVPETALPALVEALGQSAISMGAQVLFDHQLDAQYVLTDFDNQGQVTRIDDYNGRENAARALIDDFMGDGGEKLAIGMFEGAIARMQTLGYSKETIESMRGMDAILKGGLVRAMESTVLKGNVLVLTNDGQLVAACYAIKKYTDEINDLGKTLNIEVPELRGPEWAEGLDLGRGEKAALQKLMAARVTAQEKAKNALAAGIVRTFEERKRAEVELAKGREEALATLNELQKIFEELQVKDDGMQALEREGTYTAIQGWFTFPRDKQIKAMQAVLKFRDAYSFVLEARSRAEEMGRSNIGQAYAGTPRPLTGPFSPVTAPTLSTGLPSNVGPLVLDAGLDTGLTQEYLKDVSDIKAKLTRDLEVIKGGKLEGDYDTQMYGKLYGIRFQRAYWSHMFRVAGQSGNLISTVQAWRQTQRHSLSENAFNKDQALGKNDAALLEEFKQYYAQAKASISIAGPKTGKPNTPVNLAATVTFQAKPEPQYEVRWLDVTRGQGLPSGSALTFTPGDAQSYRVKAEAFATIQGKEQKIAETFHDIAVTQDDTKKDDKADGKPTTGDPKKQAEEKYQWLKQSVAYLEALKEFDRKSYNAFEKSVTGSIVREFVSKAPPQNEKGFKLPDGNDKELCGETFGDIKGRLTGYDSDCWAALNTGCKTIGTRETTRTVDGKEMKILESVTSCDAPCGKASTCSTVLMTYTGQLGYANSLQDYVNENQLHCLGDAGAANGKHQRELDAKIKNLPDSLPYKRFQEFAGLSDWKGYLAAVEKVKQEFALPEPIPSPVVLPWTYSSPCGGGGSIAETPKLAVTLAAKPEKTSYKPGDVVNVTAAVTGGKPPYAYAWTGDHAGEGQTVTRAASQPGSYALSVEVKDGAGARAQSSITLKYEGVTLDIAGLLNQVVYGTSLTLRAKTSIDFGEKPAAAASPPSAVDPEEEKWCSAWRECEAARKTDPNLRCLQPPDYLCEDITPPKPQETSTYRVIWQSDKTLDFKPGTSYDGTTEVLFDRMGVIKIWAEIQKKTGNNVYEQVGEAEQREATVVAPKFKMTFVPEKGKGKIGQEVRVTIDTDPPGIKPEIVNYEWNWPESSGRMEYEKNASVIGFVPKDPKPVKLLVAPKTVYDRVPIGGGILDEYTAGAFDVTVTGPRQMGPTPQIWKEGVGLVNVEQQIAVFQNVSMRAEVAPDPEKKPLRYQWSIAPEGCTIGNDISQEITVNCSQTGSFQAKVTVKDKDGADLGSGSGTISVTISQQTLNDSAKKAKEAVDKTKETADKKKKADEAKKKLDEAKADERKGKLDDAIKKADEAAALDPANKEAMTLATKWKAEKKRVEEQIAKTKQLIDESKFVDAQRELTVAKNLHGNYQPVVDVEKLLTEKWRGYDGNVRDKLYEVRSANEKKDFKKALELAEKMRKETKLYGGNEESLKQQEDWARRSEAEKETKRKAFNAADAQLKVYDYAGALKGFEAAFMNAQNLFNGSEPEYAAAIKARDDAFLKNKRLTELVPYVQRAAEDTQWQMPVDVMQGALKTADEAIALQPNNEQLKKWRVAIEARLGKTTTDNERLAQGRKYLEAGRTAENSYLSQEAYVRADASRWGEDIEGQMQAFLGKAIENYRASLQYIPDPKVEQTIKQLQTTLEGRKKYLENVRLSKKLRGDADALAKEARVEQNFDASQQKFAGAIDAYQQSLKLYRPADAETIGRIISNLDIERKTNAFKKYRADGTVLEQQRPVEALAALEKAATFRTYAIIEGEWILFTGQLQNLRSRVQSAKDLRARGEAQQKQGKVADAIASYEQSVKLVPDKALDEHIKLLRTQVTKENDKKVNADKLWQEGTALFNQGRPADALPKFKESLTYWQDATRTKYVQDMEGRRTQAQTLRDQGAQLQQQNRLPDAIAKYNQSLQFWPDPKLKEHIASLEAKLKQDQETERRKTQAKQLRDEGYALQQKSQLQAAVGKYRESLAIWPDKQLEEYVRQLDTKITAVSGTTGTSTPPSASSWTGAWKSDPRPGKEDVVLVLTQDGNRVTGTYNVDVMLPNGAGGQQKVSMSGKLGGTISGTKVNGFFRDREDKENTATFEWTMASDGNSFTVAAHSDGKTEAWTARRLGSEQATASHSFDGTYSGSIFGVTSGTIQFSATGDRVSGTINGTYQGDRFNGSWTGTLNRNTGAMQATLKGDIAGYAFTGNLAGRIEGTQASGTWAAKNQYGNPMGSWGAKKSGNTSSLGAGGTTGSVAGSTSQRGTSVTAEITNKSRQNAHVFVEGETFSPSNRLTPGESRKVSVAMPANGSITFKAGRDGQVMATKRWDGEPGNPSRVPVVIFDDSNPFDKLVISTGLR